MKTNLPFKHIRLLYLVFIFVFRLIHGQDNFDYSVHENLEVYNLPQAKLKIDRLIDDTNVKNKALGYYYLYEYATLRKNTLEQQLAIDQLKNLPTKYSENFLGLITANLYSQLDDTSSFTCITDSIIGKMEQENTPPLFLNQLYKARFNYVRKKTPIKIRRYDVASSNNYALLTKNNFIISDSYNDLLKYYAEKLHQTTQKIYNDSVTIAHQRAIYYSELITDENLKKYSIINTIINFSTNSKVKSQSRDIDNLIKQLQIQLETLTGMPNENSLRSRILLTLGQLYEENQSYTQSLDHYTKAYHILDVNEPNNNELYSDILDHLSIINHTLGNTNDAFLWTDKYNAYLKDNAEKNKIKISETWQQLNNLKDPPKRNFLTINKLILFGTITAASVILLLFILYTQKLKRKIKNTNFSVLREKQRNNILRLQLEAEDNNNKEAILIETPQEIEVSETSAKTVKTSHINQLECIFNESSTFNHIKKLLDEDTPPPIKPHDEQNLRLPNHPELYQRLNKLSKSKLTHLDYKYASFIYMNLNNDEIAKIMNVESKTVRMTKYRLKQKLGLKKDEDLKSFILKIQSE